MAITAVGATLLRGLPLFLKFERGIHIYDQLIKLEDVIHKLEQINSLFKFMTDNYFCTTEPDKGYLVASYEDLSNIINLICDTVYTQRNSLKDATYTLYDIRKELKALAVKKHGITHRWN